MRVPPAAVWDVLADPAEYGRWVVGSKDIRDADSGFPAAGTRFHHSVGIGPLTLRDETEVLEVEPPRRMRLRARARPLGEATVTIELSPEAGGTVVEMVEHPAGPFAAFVLKPLADLATKLRNTESLRRLEDRARRRSV
jgi:uncharacterized protein YndB with AHSA1/START domain